MPFDFLLKMSIKDDMLRDNYIGVTTDQGRAQKALEYVNKHKASSKGWWLLVGRWSEWPNDDVVPLPITTTTKIPEIIGFWKITYVSLVYEDPNGIIYTAGSNFTAIEPTTYQQVTDIKANSVLLSTTLNHYPYETYFTYRILGICTSITPSVNIPVENEMFIDAEKVENYFLDWYANCKPVNVYNQASYKVNIIRTF